MSFSEKQDDEFSEQEKEDAQNNNEITNIEENQRNSLNNNIYIKNGTKKNHTLQFYKFLFYTMKTEIKVHDFLKLIRNSIIAELSLWTISVVLYANIPKNFPVLKEGEKSKVTYSSAFLWLHLLHIVR